MGLVAAIAAAGTDMKSSLGEIPPHAARILLWVCGMVQDSSDNTNRFRACCVHLDSRNTLYIVVFRASSHVQMIPSERDLL
jgi:hypothetical protein